MISVFQSETVDLLRITIRWANEELPVEEKLNGSRRLRLEKTKNTEI
jgi:hypothetical protein